MNEAVEAIARLKNCEIARLKIDKFTQMLNYAGLALEQAKLELLLAQRANTTGERQMPLNEGAAKRFFEEKGGVVVP